MKNKKLKQQILSEYEAIAVTPGAEVWERFENHMNMTEKPRSKKPTKLFIKILAITVAIFILATAVAAAFGYNIFDLAGRKLSDLFDKTPTEYNGKDIIWNQDDTRYYDSMSDMLEKERLDILYPVELPNGYNFDKVEISAYGTYLTVNAYAYEPHISFWVEIKTSQIAPKTYSHELNGIKYNITECDGLYQAWWFYGDDYYWIVVSDEAILSEIINNLQETEAAFD